MPCLKANTMKEELKKENERAFRIQFSTAECHGLLTNIYENLVDRDFKLAEKDLRTLMVQVRILLKSIEDDDF